MTKKIIDVKLSLNHSVNQPMRFLNIHLKLRQFDNNAITKCLQFLKIFFNQLQQLCHQTNTN